MSDAERLSRRELLSKARTPASRDRTITGHITSGIGYLVMVTVDQAQELIPSGTPVTIIVHEKPHGVRQPDSRVVIMDDHNSRHVEG